MWVEEQTALVPHAPGLAHRKKELHRHVFILITN